MRLSRKSEYACLALVDLAEHYSQGYVKLADIVERKDIPKDFLVQLLLRLKNAGYVKSLRGVSGGYRLAKPPQEISIAEIIRLMDGAIAAVGAVSEYFYEATPIEKCAPLVMVFKDIRDYAAEKLENTTFADLACTGSGAGK